MFRKAAPAKADFLIAVLFSYSIGAARGIKTLMVIHVNFVPYRFRRFSARMYRNFKIRLKSDFSVSGYILKGKS